MMGEEGYYTPAMQYKLHVEKYSLEHHKGYLTQSCRGFEGYLDPKHLYTNGFLSCFSWCKAGDVCTFGVQARPSMLLRLGNALDE